MPRPASVSLRRRSFLWARVDYASRAAKNSPLGCFCPFFCDGAAAVRIRQHENSILLQTENRQRISTLAVFLWARVDYASRAAKNSPLGCFCPFFCDGAAAVRIRQHENSILLQTENRQRISTLAVFLWARVDYASRASKKAPQGLFSPPDCSAGRCCSNPPA